MDRKHTVHDHKSKIKYKGLQYEINQSHHSPYLLEEVADALSEIGVEGMTVSEVKGFEGKKVTQKFIVVMNTRWIFYPK